MYTGYRINTNLLKSVMARWRRWNDESMDDILTNSLRYETHDHLMGVPTGEGIGRSKQWKKFLHPIRLPHWTLKDLERDVDSNKTTKARARGRGIRIKRGPLRRPGQNTVKLLSSEMERDETWQKGETAAVANTVSKETIDDCRIDTPNLGTDECTVCFSYNTMSNDSASDITVATSGESSWCMPTNDDTDKNNSDVFLINNITVPLQDSQTSVNLKDNDESNSYCSQSVNENEETESDSEVSGSQFSKIDFLEDIQEKIAANHSVLTAKLQEKLVQEDLWVSTRTTVTVENLPLDIKAMLIANYALILLLHILLCCRRWTYWMFYKHLAMSLIFAW